MKNNECYQFSGSILDHFRAIKDPRIERKKEHKLHDIFVISVCAFICGCEGASDIEAYGKAKEKWFKTFLDLPNGIPSHDTIGRVFRNLDPEEFSKCFISWIKSLESPLPGDILAVDGKTVRRSFDRASKKNPIHMVSVYSSREHLVLGQTQTNEKSNEIKAIPKILSLLDISNRIITIDAMGCQKKIADLIKEKNGDYIFNVKNNQKELYRSIELCFENELKENFEDSKLTFHETKNKNHGRDETRRFWSTENIGWFDGIDKWCDLKSFSMVEYEKIGDAAHLSGAVRHHWGIENTLHWTLDVTFREDDSRIRKDHGPANFATLRHIAFNLVKSNASEAKKSVKVTRKIAGWSNDNLLQILKI